MRASRKQAEKQCAKELKEWGMYGLPPLCHPRAFSFCWGSAVASTMLTPVRPSAKQHSEELRMINGEKNPNLYFQSLFLSMLVPFTQTLCE